MDTLNFLVIVSITTLFISIFLAFFLLSVKTEHKLGNRLFAGFILLSAVDISGVLFSSFFNSPSGVSMFRASIIFLQLPTFYLYVLSVVYADFKLKPKHLLHALPFVFANLILIPRFYSANMEAKTSFLQNGKDMIEIQFNHIFIHIQIVIYLIAAFMLLRKARKLYLENYAGASLAFIQWLFQLTLALSIFYTIALLKNVFKFSDYPEVSERLIHGLFVFELMVLSWYLLKALNHPSLFRNIDAKLKLLKDIIAEEGSKSLSQETVLNQDEEVLKLKNYIQEKEPFLNPSLTIQNMADDLQIPVRDLSLLINHKLDQHFFDFINSFRIEKAKKILEDSSKNKTTVLEILYEVGFNSKSSFNTAFKKHVGLTPTQYRKNMNNNHL